MTQPVKWTIDNAHSEISFHVKHLMVSNIRCGFRAFDASIYTSGKDFSTAQINLWIAADSVYSNDPARDEQLKGPDFFDTAQHPQLNFVSHTIRARGNNGNHDMWGDLTIKGITKNVLLNLQFGGIQNFKGNQIAGFTVTGKVNRSDWNMKWNTIIDTGGVMIGEEISITCNIEVYKRDPAALSMAFPEPV